MHETAESSQSVNRLLSDDTDVVCPTYVHLLGESDRLAMQMGRGDGSVMYLTSMPSVMILAGTKPYEVCMHSSL